MPADMKAPTFLTLGALAAACACSGPHGDLPPNPTDAGADAGRAPCASRAVADGDGGFDVAIASAEAFTGYGPQDFTVCLPPGPFAKAVLTYQAVGGSGADCADHASWYPASDPICSATGDHVDRVLSNGLVFPPEVADGGMADGGFYLELNRAVTNYGGTTAFQADLSFAAPLLGGTTTFRSYLQTGCSKGGFSVTESLHLVPGAPPATAFALAAGGLQFQRIADDPQAGSSGANVELELPMAFPAAQLLVFATGHNGQGQACEEFCPGKTVVFTVDGADAGTLEPRMGAGDPTCVACCDGCGGAQGCAVQGCAPGGCGQGVPMTCTAASGCCGAAAIEREGWCPGKASPPYLLPVGDLAPGRHALHFTAPGAATQGGYWLISAALVAP